MRVSTCTRRGWHHLRRCLTLHTPCDRPASLRNTWFSVLGCCLGQVCTIDEFYVQDVLASYIACFSPKTKDSELVTLTAIRLEQNASAGVLHAWRPSHWSVRAPLNMTPPLCLLTSTRNKACLRSWLVVDARQRTTRHIVCHRLVDTGILVYRVFKEPSYLYRTCWVCRVWCTWGPVATALSCGPCRQVHGAVPTGEC